MRDCGGVFVPRHRLRAGGIDDVRIVDAPLNTSGIDIRLPLRSRGCAEVRRRRRTRCAHLVPPIRPEAPHQRVGDGRARIQTARATRKLVGQDLPPDRRGRKDRHSRRHDRRKVRIVRHRRRARRWCPYRRRRRCSHRNGRGRRRCRSRWSCWSRWCGRRRRRRVRRGRGSRRIYGRVVIHAGERTEARSARRRGRRYWCCSAGLADSRPRRTVGRICDDVRRWDGAHDRLLVQGALSARYASRFFPFRGT